MSFHITPYTSEEHAALVQSWLDADARQNTGMEDWDEDIHYWQKESPETFHALIFGDPVPAAAVYFFTEPDKLHIGEILVDPAMRGKGVGTAVLKYLLYTYSGCRKAAAVIFPDNIPSQRAFRKAGFVHTSTHPDGDAAYFAFHRPAVTIADFGKLEPWQYGEQNPYRFVVIFARYRNQWLYARHKERRTWETAGGHIEPGETPLEAAGRELWEETGAVDYTIRPVFDYHVDNSAAKPGDHAAGQVFLADISTLGAIPESEMAETSLWEEYPPVENLTYPAILPFLFQHIRNIISESSMQAAEAVSEQYKTPANLQTRISIHQKYSVNKQGFGNWIYDQYPLRENMRILELGCGDGSMWREKFLPDGTTLTLSDFSEGMVNAAAESTAGIKGISCRQIDIQSIPFPENSFDLVIANMMLYHVPDLSKALREVRRVLKPDGIFCCATFGENGITEYVQDLLQDYGIRKAQNHAFTLQNGAGILSGYFQTIERRDYMDALEITEPEDLLDYLYSMTFMTDFQTIPRETIRNILTSRMENGVLHIPKEYGMFLAQ